jgi:L-threonylcarbamoyladenylate synthase
MSASLGAEDAQRLRDCVAEGGVAVFPTDTVYGLCCDPDDERAAARLYELKGRPARRSSAVMFFALDHALEVLGELAEAERLALEVLLPGPLTLLLANRPQRFAAACRRDPGTLGLRVPRLPENLSALVSIDCAVMQSSANLSGEQDARSLEEIPQQLLDGADLVLDGGELPGTPSTVIDLRDFDSERRWHVLREGALPRESVQQMLAPLR